MCLIVLVVFGCVGCFVVFGVGCFVVLVALVCLCFLGFGFGVFWFGLFVCFCLLVSQPPFLYSHCLCLTLRKILGG